MAKYNITANGNQLVITLIVTDQDFSPNIRTFKTPSIKLTPFTVKFMEDGFYKMALNLNEINEIGGVVPIDLNNAAQLIINLTETPSVEYNFDLTSPNWTLEGVTDKLSFINWLETRNNNVPNDLINIVINDFNFTGNRISCNMTADATLYDLSDLDLLNADKIGVVNGLEELHITGNLITEYNPYNSLPNTLMFLFLGGNKIEKFNPTNELPLSLIVIDFNRNLFDNLGYTNTELWANSQTSFTSSCNVRFALNTNSVTGTNLETILLTKNCTISP